ncbi:MAG: 3-methyl-2-oxobutanoate hydroxymethyltransferase [Gammaproteobacteria bacterium]|nr:3-methyl-2-oxobutanoate hydroxymethyltransferase [Gammaproteobacteria bacterium]
MMTTIKLREKKQAGEKITCLTAYDASFAAIEESAGIDAILVGDSLGMVLQGHTSTLPVTIEDMVYHTSLVRRGAPASFLIADMPFMADASVESALLNAGQLVKAGATCIKLEGAQSFTLEIVTGLAQRGVPVCGHIGLQPQSVNKLGGYRVQGKDSHQAIKLVEDAHALEQAGADIIVLECVPATLAQEITRNLSIPTIGIGAGAGCDGQVLVIYDLLGITRGKRAKFVKDFLQGCDSIEQAVCAYRDAVKSGEFPSVEHSFQA